MKRCCKNINLTSAEIIEPFIERCIKRHGKRRDFRHFILQKGLENEYRQFLNKEENAPYEISYKLSVEIADMIKHRAIPPLHVWASQRYDESSRKMRLIGNETVLQRLLDYIVTYGCEELWERKLFCQQCASIPSRGQIYGMRLLRHYALSDERAMKYAVAHHIRYTRKCKYFVKLDIRHCYESIDRNLLMERLTHDIKNDDMLYLWSVLLKSYEEVTNGILIGALLSQFASQYLVSNICRRALNNKAVTHMVTYMDDMVLFSSNRRKLLKAVNDLIRCASDELHLTIKSNFSIKRFDEEPLDMMGYVVHSNSKVTIRAKAFIHARRLIKRYKKNGYMTYIQAKRLISFKGYFIYSDCQKIQSEFFKAFKHAQNVVSKHERRNKYGMGNINS